MGACQSCLCLPCLSLRRLRGREDDRTGASEISFALSSIITAVAFDEEPPSSSPLHLTSDDGSRSQGVTASRISIDQASSVSMQRTLSSSEDSLSILDFLQEELFSPSRAPRIASDGGDVQPDIDQGAQQERTNDCAQPEPSAPCYPPDIGRPEADDEPTTSGDTSQPPPETTPSLVLPDQTSQASPARNDGQITDGGEQVLQAHEGDRNTPSESAVNAMALPDAEVELHGLEGQRTDLTEVTELGDEPYSDLEEESIWDGFHPEELDFMRAESAYARQIARQRNPFLPWTPSQLAPARENAPPNTAWILPQRERQGFRFPSAYNRRAEVKLRLPPESPRGLRVRSHSRSWRCKQEGVLPADSLLLSGSHITINDSETVNNGRSLEQSLDEVEVQDELR
ncbi:hypothetical protein BKA70DRAFT_228965 [Coprinopsis sp. MPI-PUGE-AT-0042]|nr:hypothetical protein BKA70DRAFT_228965 [Coprinopsis sp. MPI-PUGE-AT-0042]